MWEGRGKEREKGGENLKGKGEKVVVDGKERGEEIKEVKT